MSTYVFVSVLAKFRVKTALASAWRNAGTLGRDFFMHVFAYLLYKSYATAVEKLKLPNTVSIPTGLRAAYANANWKLDFWTRYARAWIISER